MAFNYYGPNKSVFGKETYRKAIGTDETNGYAVLKIEPRGNKFTKRPDPGVKGVIRDNLEMQLTPTWTTMGGQGGIVPSIMSLAKLPNWYGGASTLIQGGANAAGFSQIGAVFSSKKVYQQSGYLTITPSMRIVNWYDDALNSPMVNAFILLNYCVPGDAINGFKELKDFLKQKTPGALKIFNAIADGIKEGVEGVVNAADSLIPDGAADEVAALGQGLGNLGREVFDGVDDLQVLRKSPTPVRVTIGQYFQHDDMIVESVRLKFSKEQTENGPLYLDAYLTLSTRRVVYDIEYSGLQHANKWATAIKSVSDATEAPTAPVQASTVFSPGDTFSA